MNASKLILVGAALVIATMTLAQHVNRPTRVRLYSGGEGLSDKIVGEGQQMTTALNYKKRLGTTKVSLRGTMQLPKARGDARVENKRGHIDLKAEFKGLPSVERFGPEYLTYVVWAVTPEGCAYNLGEVLPNEAKSTLATTVQADVFGLVVTAEPYFAVSRPGDVVVMENRVNKSWGRQTDHVDVKYDVLPRGSYTANVSSAQLKPIITDPRTPYALYEARNAFWIALWAGADRNAAELFAKAKRSLERVEGSYATHREGELISAEARETVKNAEDARRAALKSGPESSSHPDSCNVYP